MSRVYQFQKVTYRDQFGFVHQAMAQTDFRELRDSGKTFETENFGVKGQNRIYIDEYGREYRSYPPTDYGPAETPYIDHDGVAWKRKLATTLPIISLETWRAADALQTRLERVEGFAENIEELLERHEGGSTDSFAEDVAAVVRALRIVAPKASAADLDAEVDKWKVR